MSTFIYKAKAPNGSVLEGLIEAEELKQAMEKLKNQRFVVLELNEKKAGIGEFLKSLNPMKPKVASKDLVIFSRQLSTLVAAGVPIVQGLSILESQAESPVFKSVLAKVKTDIESGLSISDAMKKHPEAFPELYVSMIKAGELGGILDTILERLSAYLENSEALKGKVKSAMMYPAVISTIAGAVTVFLLVGVIPTFKEIFESFGAELPLPTQILINMSDFLKNQILLVLATPVAAVFGIKRFYATPAGRAKIDAILLKLPLFGVILKKVAIAKFTRTLGTLMKSGVPILQALETVASTAGNVVVEGVIRTTMDSIREGGRLTDPLKKSPIFPNMVVQMIGVGEETGSLDQMLTKIADFYDQEVDDAVKGLTSMMEPLIMVVMGIVIGGIVIAMFMPMMSLGDLASQSG